MTKHLVLPLHKAPRISERLRRLNAHDERDSFLLFCLELAEKKVESTYIGEELVEYIKFANVLFGEGVRRRSSYPILVRKNYPTIWAAVKGERTNPHNGTGFVLEGTPGMGKSVFGAYAILQRILDGAYTLFLFKDKKDVLFVGKDNDPDLQKFGCERKGVYVIEDKSVLDELRSVTGILVVLDPGEYRSVDRSSAFTLVVSSSNVKLKEFTNEVENTQAVTRFIEPWLEEELLCAASLNVAINPGVTLHEDPQAISGKYNIYGGCARHVLGPTSVKDAATKVKNMVKRLSTDALRALITSEYKGPGIPSTLVHYSPSPHDSSLKIREFASIFITDLLLETFTEQRIVELCNLMDAAKGDGDWGVLRGRLYEGRIHAKIRDGTPIGLTFIGTYMPNVQTNARTHVTINFPRPHPSQLYNDLNEINQPLLFTYFQPSALNAESIDAVELMEASIFFENAQPGELAVVYYQFFLRKNRQHGLKGNGLVQPRNLFLALTGDRTDVRENYVYKGALRYVIIIVSDTDVPVQNIMQVSNSRVVYNKSRLSHFAMDIPQYLCKTGNFAALAQQQ